MMVSILCTKVIKAKIWYLYITPLDGSQAPIRITENPAPDFSPSWSPEWSAKSFSPPCGVAHKTSTYSHSDDPRDEVAVNLTQTDSRNEDFASWSPNGELVAFSAYDEGLSKVFVTSLQPTNATPQVLERGKMPSWSPDGAALVFIRRFYRQHAFDCQSRHAKRNCDTSDCFTWWVLWQRLDGFAIAC
ncbi:MAG UNVERIFIED_CONTAM: hypothetical protein LVT10_12705 [Anaerolineae bacterium]